MRRASVFVASLLTAVSIFGAAPAFGAQGGTDRPIKGSATGFGPIDFETFTLLETGSGSASHLGKTSDTAFAFLDTGTTIYKSIAPNGDELDSISVEGLDPAGVVCPDERPIAFKLVVEYTGGTGRFAHATGSNITTGCSGLVFDGTTLFVATTWTFVGRISY